MDLNEPDTLNQEAITTAIKSGQSPDVVNMVVELQKSQLEKKLKILGNILTLEQLNTYRQEQTDKINMLANATKMFLPQKPAGTSN